MSDAQTKNQQTIADYFGDLVALETHIHNALNHQLKLAEGNPDAGPLVKEFHDTASSHLEALRAAQAGVGSTAGNPVIAVGSAFLGKVAGLIDMIRTESISKALRDDYTAMSLAAISYGMFHATASALGDAKTSDLAMKHLTDYASAVQKISRSIADVVVSELANDGHQVDAGAPNDTTEIIKDSFKTTGATS
jgi:hypothetical protein